MLDFLILLCELQKTAIEKKQQKDDFVSQTSRVSIWYCMADFNITARGFKLVLHNGKWRHQRSPVTITMTWDFTKDDMRLTILEFHFPMLPSITMTSHDHPSSEDFFGKSLSWNRHFDPANPESSSCRVRVGWRKGVSKRRPRTEVSELELSDGSTLIQNSKYSKSKWIFPTIRK